MPAPQQILFSLPAMRTLLREEALAVRARLPARAGSLGLQLGMCDMAGGCADVVAHWVRMQQRGEAWVGDIRAETDQALPFGDDAFAVVWLSQAQQFHADARRLLGEAVRVTAPGGLLVVAGVHPLSLWAPWLAWCMHDAGQRIHLRLPAHLEQVMITQGMQLADAGRFGRALPRASAAQAGSPLFGGGYVLLARKRVNAVTPLRRDERGRAPVRGRLAPGAHRECA